jgi:hypothetical protein
MQANVLGGAFISKDIITKALDNQT